MSLTYREDYWDSALLKAEYNRFMKTIHGLELSAWDRAGFWDNDYRPFSYFDGDRLVANVSIYSMDMTIANHRCRVAQVSAVGTLPEYRRQGLSIELTRRAMDWARDRHEFFFLFADEDAMEFYRKRGFRRVDEFKTRVPVTGTTATPGAVKLDMEQENDRSRVFKLASVREPVSKRLGVHTPRLLMFWCLYFLNDGVYYIRDPELVVLLRREAGLLTLHDIVGRNIPPFAAIYPYICDPGDEAVEFMFMTDRLGLDNPKLIKTPGGDAHLYGDFPLENEPIIFPTASRA